MEGDLGFVGMVADEGITQITFSIDGIGGNLEVDNLLQGVTLNDGTVIYSMCFDVIGALGQSSPITFGGSPTGIEFVDNNGNFPTPTFTSGMVTVSGSSSNPAAIPTMGEWAMFLFALIMLSMGLVFVFNSQQRLALSNSGQANLPMGFGPFPFDSTSYQAALKHALGAALVGFVLIFLIWGEIVNADLVGMAPTIPVLAYLIHLVKMFKKIED